MSSKTVVVLLSDKRSGSTMIQRELTKHPDIRTVDYSPHTYLETHHWLKAAVLLDQPAQTFSEGRVYRGYGSRRNARTYIVDCLEKNIPGFPLPKGDHDLVFDGWEALCKRFAAPVFFEKSPQILAHWSALSLLLEWIESTAFSVRIIGLTRNPMAVQYSASRLFHTDPETRQFGWLENQKNLLVLEKLLSPGTYHHIRYEDVIKDPKKAFAGVFDFIGVQLDPHPGAEIHDHSLSIWRDDPFFTFQLSPSVRRLAMAFGYTENELENPAKPEPPRSYRLRQQLTKFFHLGRARLYSRVLKPIWIRLKPNS